MESLSNFFKFPYKKSFKLVGVTLGTFVWLFFLLFFIQKSVLIPWPEKDENPLIYTTDCSDDLKYLISCALKKAKQSIYLASFGITDDRVIQTLQTAALAGINVEVRFDKKQPIYLKEGKNITLIPYEKKGPLMHQKVIAIDKELILLGSTNMTKAAINLHRNVIVCFTSKDLFQALLSNEILQTKTFQFYPLPKYGKLALQELIERIETAKNRIFVSMFSFTHPKIIAALKDASQRGLDVQVFIDKGSLKTTSKKAQTLLQQANIPVLKNQGQGYLHYKCALIDDTFVFGSANWTRSGFSKNEEYLIFLSHLTFKQRHKLERFFFALHATCQPLPSEDPILQAISKG